MQKFMIDIKYIFLDINLPAAITSSTFLPLSSERTWKREHCEQLKTVAC